GDLVGAPHPQRHRGQDLLELAAVRGGEQPERAPFTRLQWRAPQAQQVPRRCQFARVGGLAGADVVDGLVRRPVRDVGGHGDEVLHGRLLLVLWKWNHCPFGERDFQFFWTDRGVTVCMWSACWYG